MIPELPARLPDQQILFNLKGLGVDDGDPVGRTECHELVPPILGDANPHGLDRFFG